MIPILSEILRRTRAGEAVALCTVVATRGSTPQQRGARMIVTLDGRCVGTLGGGCVEAEVRKRAIELLDRGESKLLEFRLDHDYGWDDGLICGGIMDIHIQSIGPGEREPFERMMGSLEQGRRVELRIEYEQAGERKHFTEDLGPGPRLVIAGAGHVAQAVSELAAKLDFRITVIDDRADFASEARFPRAEKRIVGTIEDELRICGIDEDTYIVIVTRGHHRDGHALAAVIDSPARYIGLIGSKRKIKAIYDELHASGVSVETLKRIHAPIGLDIGAVSVNEIAVSIAAELIAVRRGKEWESAAPMRIDPEQVEQWLARRRKKIATDGTQMNTDEEKVV
jgi:xanthine dehydrogenase accessory factor